MGKADMVGCDYGRKRANALILLHFCFLLVRSSASIALQMHWKEFRHLLHFDFFTVNLNEQFSGLFGGVLESQTSELLPPPSFINTQCHLSSSQILFPSPLPFPYLLFSPSPSPKLLILLQSLLQPVFSTSYPCTPPPPPPPPRAPPPTLW